jgi:ribbon-helix-helix protein
MTKDKKRRVCFRIEESMVKEMKQIRDETGVPVSKQVELRLKGFTLTRAQSVRKIPE